MKWDKRNGKLILLAEKTKATKIKAKYSSAQYFALQNKFPLGAKTINDYNCKDKKWNTKTMNMTGEGFNGWPQLAQGTTLDFTPPETLIKFFFIFFFFFFLLLLLKRQKEKRHEKAERHAQGSLVEKAKHRANVTYWSLLAGIKVARIKTDSYCSETPNTPYSQK